MSMDASHGGSASLALHVCSATRGHGRRPWVVAQRDTAARDCSAPGSASGATSGAGAGTACTSQGSRSGERHFGREVRAEKLRVDVPERGASATQQIVCICKREGSRESEIYVLWQWPGSDWYSTCWDRGSPGTCPSQGQQACWRQGLFSLDAMPQIVASGYSGVNRRLMHSTW